MLEKYIELLRPEIIKIFKNDSSGHDIGHLERTMNNALFLQKHEGGDELIIGTAAFLHDIHRVLQKERGKYCTPKESLPIVKELLEKVEFPIDKTDKVLHSIEHHEIYNWNESRSQVSDIETLILQDADNLDAIGAIGIARLFSYGGAHNIIMYEPDIPLNTNDDYDEENDDDESAIYHCHHKLFKLEDNMNTSTGKKLASDKTNYMKDYVNKFIEEWNGNYLL